MLSNSLKELGQYLQQSDCICTQGYHETNVVWAISFWELLSNSMRNQKLAFQTLFSFNWKEKKKVAGEKEKECLGRRAPLNYNIALPPFKPFWFLSHMIFLKFLFHGNWCASFGLLWLWMSYSLLSVFSACFLIGP